LRKTRKNTKLGNIYCLIKQLLPKLRAAS